MITDDAKKLVPHGFAAVAMCDHCGKPLLTCLTYRDSSGKHEYCTNACFEAAEGSRGHDTGRKKEDPMIEKKTASATPADAPKDPKGKKSKGGSTTATPAKGDGPKANKQGKGGAEDKAATPAAIAAAVAKKWPKAGKGAPAPKPDAKGKKSKVTPIAEPAPAKGKKAKDAPAPAPTKAAKAPKAAKPAGDRIDWTAQNKIVEDRLMAGKALTLTELFEGTLYKDKSRILSFLVEKARSAGKEVVRDTKARTIKVVKVKK